MHYAIVFMCRVQLAVQTLDVDGKNPARRFFFCFEQKDFIDKSIVKILF